MLKFKERCILTGIEKRKSQKTGTEYTLANFLGESGQTFGCIVEGNIPQGVKQLDIVEVDFIVVPGRYTQLKVESIKKVE